MPLENVFVCDNPISSAPNIKKCLAYILPDFINLVEVVN